VSHVRQRSVFYLSGFDPKGASYYHALYRDEAAKQATQHAPLTGQSVQVGKRGRTPEGNATWTLRCEPDGVDTQFEFLRWDDVVRQHWPKGTPRLWWDVLRTTAFNLRHGALWRMVQRSWPPAFALFMPFVLVLVQMLGAPLLALGVALVLWQGGLALWLGVLVGATVGAGAWWITRRLEARYAMYWMMRSYAFTRLQALGRAPHLEQRLDEHAALLVARWREGRDDEILVVGHSTGAVMAVSVLARACALEPGLGGSGPRVALLTLGQWIPLLGLLPQAQRFRDELARLAGTTLDWLDFSAPPDGCCFALTDPYALCGVAPARPDFPKLLNPRFAEMFDAPAYRVLKRDKFKLHFQYLMASERATDYDYFAITAGGRYLAERFAQIPGVRHYRELLPFWRRR
jgi:hypothetical protein